MSIERDPPRLVQGGAAHPALAQALGAARARFPSDDVLAQIAAKLPSGSSGPPSSGGGGGGNGGGAPVAAPPAMWPGIVVGAALGGLVGGASLFIGSPAPSLPAQSATSPGTARSQPAAPAETAQPGATATATLAAKAAAPHAGGSSFPAAEAGAGAEPPAAGAESPVAASASPDESEADYLRRAHAQIGSAPGQALAMAEAYPQRYPGGKLGQEREMIAISALAALGRTAEARARAKVFLTLFPESAHRRRLEVLLPDLAGPEKNLEP
jgi:hypothetical protein